MDGFVSIVDIFLPFLYAWEIATLMLIVWNRALGWGLRALGMLLGLVFLDWETSAQFTNWLEKMLWFAIYAYGFWTWSQPADEAARQDKSLYSNVLDSSFLTKESLSDHPFKLHGLDVLMLLAAFGLAFYGQWMELLKEEFPPIERMEYMDKITLGRHLAATVGIWLIARRISIGWLLCLLEVAFSASLFAWRAKHYWEDITTIEFMMEIIYLFLLITLYVIGWKRHSKTVLA